MFIFEEFGLKTIKTPQKPIIIAIQLMKLSFSFKINFAKIVIKNGVTKNKAVAVTKGSAVKEI